MPWRLKTPPFEQFILGSLRYAISKHFKHLDGNQPTRPFPRGHEIRPKYLKIVPIMDLKVKD